MCIALDNYLFATENLDGQKESLYDAFFEDIFCITPLDKPYRKVLWQSYCHDKNEIPHFLEVGNHTKRQQ